jgi:mercuric reductase
MSDCCTPKNGNSQFDVAVIGAGSAGFSAAITAAGEGAQVALIGHGTIGGTCVNVGCVPSKTMIRAAEALHGPQVAARFEGIAGEAQVNDWRKVIEAKDDLVSTLRQKKYTDLLPEYNSVAYMEGAARLTSNGVAFNHTELTVGRTIIATGSTPALPDISGLADVSYLTSTTALELTDLPVSITVVGAGYIGCELAQMFARAGVAVTVVTRSRLLPETEPEVSDALTSYFSSEGINVVTGVAYKSVREDDGGISLNVSQSGEPKCITAEKLLITTGRVPNIAGLDLPEAGIALNDRGGIQIDDRMRASKAGVYAAGDVTGHDQFVYMAAYGAKIAALNAMNGDSLSYDNSVMPWVVFTDPQVAGVGFSEAAAQQAGF